MSGKAVVSSTFSSVFENVSFVALIGPKVDQTLWEVVESSLVSGDTISGFMKLVWKCSQYFCLMMSYSSVGYSFRSVDSL